MILNIITGNMTQKLFKLEWNEHDWPSYQAKIYGIQNAIYEASKKGKTEEMKELQKQIIDSPEAKLLSVKKITQENTGKKTPGVDGIIVLQNNRRNNLAKTLEINDKASPIRRCWIPKSGRPEKRPLGIPTIRDRAKQNLVKLALEPQWEGVFSIKDCNSYGFRPGRSANDARASVARWIRSVKYVLDADINKCYDRINHKYLLDKLNCSPIVQTQIESWLKAGILDKYEVGNHIEENELGTPQGGVISPLLANIALCGIEPILKEKVKKVGYIRYADDFVVIAETLKDVIEAKKLISEFLAKIGLELSEDKTKVIKSDEGFNFLGFTFQTLSCSYHHATTPSLKRRRINLPILRENKLPFRGYTYKTEPSKKAINDHKQVIKNYLKANASGTPQERIIEELSQKIRGWTNYFCVSNATRTFSMMDKWFFGKIFHWATKRCKNNRRKAYAKYFIKVKNRNWCFGYHNKKGEAIYLRRYDSTPIRRTIQVKSNESPYNNQLLYWSYRLADDNRTSKWIGRLIRKQRGECGYCAKPFYVWDNIEIHHIKELAKGGAMTKTNLSAVHRVCHHKLHNMTRPELKEIIRAERPI